MKLTNSPKINVSAINQIAYVYKDIEKAAEDYWNILGIGPWAVINLEPPAFHDRRYYGKPSVAKEKIALTQVGDVQLELVQPVEGDSIYQDYLDEHGEGLHHVNILVDDLDATVKTLTDQGCTSIQSGRVGEKGGFNYLYIEPLHSIWEPVHMDDSLDLEPIRMIPEGTQKSPAKVQINEIDQIAFIVKDVEKTAEHFWNLLGIGPWHVVILEQPAVQDFKYHSKKAVTREKVAVAQVGSIQIELAQPLEGDSIYQDFLNEHGQGMHHVRFPVSTSEDVDRISEVFLKQGFESLQSARFGPEGNYNYIYIEPLKAIWEPLHMSDGLVPIRVIPDEDMNIEKD